MVDETGHVPICCRVYDFSILRPHHIGAGGLLIFFNAFLANVRVLIEDFAHVLHHKGALLDVFTGGEPPAFLLSLHRVDVLVLHELEAAILAGVRHGAHLWDAVLCH